MRWTPTRLRSRCRRRGTRGVGDRRRRGLGPGYTPTANAGAVIRAGADVLRPSNQHSASILQFLSELQGSGFRGAPVPVGLDTDGRERLRFIPGDVAIPLYPDWVQTDESLTSLDGSIARGGEFVRRRAEAREPGFVKMWAEIGGMERFDRRRRWWATVRSRFVAALQ